MSCFLSNRRADALSAAERSCYDRAMPPPSPPFIQPPRDLAELAARAAALTGRSLDELAATFSIDATGPLLRRKGKAGQLIERALGASAGSRPVPDFTTLGVELKTVPVDGRGRALESTFVCSLNLTTADRAEWHDSPVRAKLAHVLFVPIDKQAARPIIGVPRFFRPSAAQTALLRADFEEIMERIALGQIHTLTAHVGAWLQLRPKAAHGGIRTIAYGEDDAPLATIPRGFYLRARCVEALLRDPGALAPVSRRTRAPDDADKSHSGGAD